MALQHRGRRRRRRMAEINIVPYIDVMLVLLIIFMIAAPLATAIGLVAAIPAVIIYNHFARVTKSYLELVSRASGASARLLSRDLDRSHGGAMSRAAE